MIVFFLKKCKTPPLNCNLDFPKTITYLFAELTLRLPTSPRRHAMIKEFIEFIKQYGVIGLAIAVIIGGKLNTLVGSIVDGILMPFLTFFIPGGSWRTATMDIGPFHFVPGPVIGASVDFVIVGYAVFLIAKLIMREEKVAKR